MLRLAFLLPAALACAPGFAGCSAGADDGSAADVPRDGDVDGGGEVPVSCDAAECDDYCTGTGAPAGICRFGMCVCTGGADADAEADASDDSVAEAEAEAEAEAGRTYTCLQGCRNGSEVCDDQGFTVPSPYVPMALVCESGRGGIIYVSRNTGPPCTDGVPRCQGWEQAGQNAWEFLDYVVQFPCSADGETHDIDLSAYSGSGLWVGVHDDPALGRETMMTQVCVATWN